MRCLLAFLFPLVLSAQLPEEAAVLKEIAQTEGVTTAATDLPGYAKKGILTALAAYGVDTTQLSTGGMADAAKPSHHLSYVLNKEGHILALHGNGPWLRNSSLEKLIALPELRILRIDHNGYVGKDTRVAEFSGKGFLALVGSKLTEIKIGLSFADEGMAACAQIASLRSFEVAHSLITEAGLLPFTKHAGITKFSVAEMASSRVTEKALATLALIPSVTQLGFKECYVTYEGGYSHLAALKGKLTEIDLTSSLSSEADLARLKADHPQAKITVISAPEIVKRHKYIAAQLAKQAPPEVAAPLKAALGVN